MSSPHFQRPLLNTRQRFALLLSVMPAAIVAALYLIWWLYPPHHVWLPFSIGATYIVVYELLAPFWLYFWAARAVRPASSLTVPDHWRVAMVVTRAPAERFEDVVPTLLGCVQREGVSVDVWLADEDPTAEALAWCRSLGIKVCSRRGRDDYHRPTWPRRTRCKEGNLAFFYDRVGYSRYDFVLQLDSDHVPALNYAQQMLLPFNDPRVGYVAAPSICDRGAERSWFARGRLYAEAPLHGIQQAGYSNGAAPLAIGSHYAVRTAALKEIGGLGPELAEDHSTSLLMNAAGWRGSFSINAIAHGEGPATVVDGLTQEFQWSRSIMVIFLTLLPGKLRRRDLPLRLWPEFIYSELWYPLFGGTAVVGYLLLAATLLLDVPMMRVNYLVFLAFAAAYAVAAVLPMMLLRRWDVLRPRAPLVSWEAPLFELVRLPWVVLGLLAGILQVVSGREPMWRVTPKGVDPRQQALPSRLLAPYWVAGVLTTLVVLLTPGAVATQPYWLLALVAAGWAILTGLLVALLHPRRSPVQLLTYVAASLLLAVTGGLRAPAGFEALQQSFQQRNPPIVPRYQK